MADIFAMKHDKNIWKWCCKLQRVLCTVPKFHELWSTNG